VFPVIHIAFSDPRWSISGIFGPRCATEKLGLGGFVFFPLFLSLLGREPRRAETNGGFGISMFSPPSPSPIISGPPPFYFLRPLILFPPLRGDVGIIFWPDGMI